jgi:hypothetical protein
MWTRDVQNVVFSILFCGWLGGMGAEAGKLFTIEEVGKMLDGMSNRSLRFKFNILKYPSISRIETLSTSPSKSISNPSSPSSKNWQD